MDTLEEAPAPLLHCPPSRPRHNPTHGYTFWRSETENTYPTARCATASHRPGCRVSQTSGLRVWGVVRHLSTNGGRSGEQAREASVAKATRSSETVTLCAPAWFTQFRLPKTNKTQFMLRQPISQVIPPRTHLLLTRSTRSL